MDEPVFGTKVAGCPYIPRPSAYAIVRNAMGCFALVRTPRGFFLPGGGIKGSETPEQAIEREAREEAGLILDSQGRVGKAIDIVYSVEENACFEKRSVFVAAEVVGQAAESEGDHELIWMERDEAMRMVSQEGHRWAIQVYGAGRHSEGGIEAGSAG